MNYNVLKINRLNENRMFISKKGTTRPKNKECKMSLENTAIINKAKQFVQAYSTINAAEDISNYISDDIEFSGPNIPRTKGKKEFLDVFKKELVSVYRAIPDLQTSSFGYDFDSIDKNTVFLKLKQKGTLSGPYSYKGEVFAPNNQKIEFPVESCSITYSGDLVSKFTKGYICDKTSGNTGGLLSTDGILSFLGESPSTLKYKPLFVAFKEFFGRNRKRFIFFFQILNII